MNDSYVEMFAELLWEKFAREASPFFPKPENWKDVAENQRDAWCRQARDIMERMACHGYIIHNPYDYSGIPPWA